MTQLTSMAAAPAVFSGEGSGGYDDGPLRKMVADEENEMHSLEEEVENFKYKKGESHSAVLQDCAPYMSRCSFGRNMVFKP